MQRTPKNANARYPPWSPMTTRSMVAQITDQNQGAVPKKRLSVAENTEQPTHTHDGEPAISGGETHAGDMLSFDDDMSAGYVPDPDPADRLRNMDPQQGIPPQRTLQEAMETLTRLQLDMIRRNADEMQRIKQRMHQELQTSLREEIRAAMREEMRMVMREELRAVVSESHNEPAERETVAPTHLRDNTANMRQPNVEPAPKWQNHSAAQSIEDIPVTNRRRPSTNLQIEKWGIKFDGDANKITVDDFIFRVEHLRAYHQASWHEVIGDFHKLLGGKAAEWFWIQVRMTGVPDWPSLRGGLRRTYSTRQTNFELERDLMERIQRPGENIDDYIHEMCRLRAQLRVPISEYEMVRVLKRNIRESVGKILFPMDISSVERLRAEYHAVEKAFISRGAHRAIQPTPGARNYYAKPHINEISNEDEWGQYDPEPMVDELLELSRNRPQLHGLHQGTQDILLQMRQTQHYNPQMP